MNGFEEAKQHRNWLERLGAKIPGFKGYLNRELRRDVDRMQREHLSKELGRIKGVVRAKARDFVDAGQIGVLHLFERLDNRVDGLSQAVRFADYGASGLFDVVKVGEPELESLYEFDLSLLEDLERLEGSLRALPAAGQGSSSEVKDAVDAALSGLTALSDKWAERDNVISRVVQQ